MRPDDDAIGTEVVGVRVVNGINGFASPAGITLSDQTVYGAPVESCAVLVDQVREPGRPVRMSQAWMKQVEAIVDDAANDAAPGKSCQLRVNTPVSQRISIEVAEVD